MTVTIVGARQRAERLVKLYDLRAQLEEEIHAIEATMANEAEMVRQVREESRKKARLASCGTDAGYYRHIKSGPYRGPSEPACPACLAAHAAATARREQRRQEAS